MAHEMCHLWQHHLGKPSKRTYHNKEWGNKMKSIGLYPSNTGKEGGKEYGQQMMDYIIDGGIFVECINKLIKEDPFKNLWYDRIVRKDAFGGPTNKVDYDVEEDNKEEEEVEKLTDEEQFYDDLGLNPMLYKANFDLAVEYTSPGLGAKSKYNCNSCNTNVWGKPGLNIICGECRITFDPVF